MGFRTAGRGGCGSKIVVPLIALTAWVATPDCGAAQTTPTSLTTPDFTASTGVEITRDVVYGRTDGMATQHAPLSGPGDL